MRKYIGERSEVLGHFEEAEMSELSDNFIYSALKGCSVACEIATEGFEKDIAESEMSRRDYYFFNPEMKTEIRQNKLVGKYLKRLLTKIDKLFINS